MEAVWFSRPPPFPNSKKEIPSPRNSPGKTSPAGTGPGSGSFPPSSALLLQIFPAKNSDLAGKAGGILHLPLAQQILEQHVFARMSVEENLRMGAYIIKDQRKIQENLEKVYAHFPRLKERSRQLAGTLSGGEQQMLATGRALMTSGGEQQMLATGRALMTGPKIVLMDEPSMGLSPILVKEIFAIIEELHKSGITILLVEQNAKMALAVSDRAYVLETGVISMEGPAAQLAADDRVRKAYLGA